MKFYEIRDPIYGFIRFNELEKAIIDHPVFQRLRRIRQLGLTELVYPSAIHTRFEHSLGVMHLATEFFDAIIKDEDNLKILENNGYPENSLDRVREVIRLAALLHDIGHTPFSHVGENMCLMKNKIDGKHYSHEDYSIKIIENILSDVIKRKSPGYNITSEEIVNLISKSEVNSGEGVFWKQIISGQLDADRCDYLLRDSYHTGVKYGIYDVYRLISTLTIENHPEEGVPVIAVDESGWHVAESIILSRYYMFTQVYFHKTRRAYDYHLTYAINSILSEEFNLEGGKFPEPNKIDEFIKFDDVILLREILRNKDDNCTRIRNRNHYRCIYERDIKCEEDEKRFNNVENALEKLVVFKDKAEKKWYEVDSNGELEIFIKNKKGKIIPLSHKSPIVGKIEASRIERLYVKPEDKEKAIKILRELGEV